MLGPRVPCLGTALLGLLIALPPFPASAQPDPAPGRTSVASPEAAARPAAERAPARLARLASALARDGDIRIVAFGSSSTEGIGASSPATTYPALLETDLEERLQIGASSRRNVVVLNRGRGGDDSEAMALRLERDVIAERPDLVVWQTGSNDPLAGVPVERFKDLTRQGIRAIRASGADVVLMDQQWCRRLSGVGDLAAYEDALHAVAAETGVGVIRRHDLMVAWASRGLLSPEQMIGPDGLHMTDAGYRRLAKAAAAQILAGAGLIQPALAKN